MKKAIVICFITTLILSALILAQDKPAPTLVLNWFPDGVYKEYGFYHNLELKKAKTFGIFKKIFNRDGDSMMGETPPLPEGLTNFVDSISFAKTLSFDTNAKMEELEDKINKAVEDKDNIDEKEVDRLAHQIHEMEKASTLWAFYIPDLDSKVREELKKGTLARSGKRLYKRPVYTLHSGGSRGTSKTETKNFAWASPTEELLIADNMETLKLMANSGMGNVPRLMDNAEYSLCADYLIYYGQIWKVKPERAIRVAKVEKMRSEMKDPEKIAREEERILEDPIAEIETFIVAEEITALRSAVYDDKEKAEQEYNKVNAQFKEAADGLKKTKVEIDDDDEKKLSKKEQRVVNSALRFAGNLLDGQETVLDGNMVTTKIVFGERQLKTLGYLIGFAEAMEQKEKDKKENEAADDEDVEIETNQ